jgi:hypothetical protein
LRTTAPAGRLSPPGPNAEAGMTPIIETAMTANASLPNIFIIVLIPVSPRHLPWSLSSVVAGVGSLPFFSFRRSLSRL